MKNRTDEELKTIASDLFHGLIFTSNHLQTPDDLSMVFMPLALMDDKRARKMQKDPPGLIYEYLNKALPRSINGLPCFMSCQLLSRPDANKVIGYWKEMKAAENKILSK